MNEPQTRQPLIVRAIDGFTSGVGRLIGWLTLVMVVIAASNAVARYVGRFIGMNLSSNAYIELQWYLFSIIFLLGAAYALREDAHVRVDVLYSRLGTRGQGIINIAGTALLLFPFCVFILWVSIPVVRNSWGIREGSPDPGGLPRYPLKALIIVCFVLLLLQGISELIKEVQRMRRHAPPHPDDMPAEGI